MCEDEINIGVTEIVNTILVEAQPNDQVIDINVSDNTEDVTINCTPNLIEVNINTGVGDKSVIVVDTTNDLPLIGEIETLYLTLDTKFLYIWDNITEDYALITDYIPYLGAIKNANLGEYGLKAGWLGLDLTPTNTPTTEGTISWNSTDGTADLKLKGGNVTLQVGQEEVVRVVNKTGATLNEADFRAVRVRSVAEGGAQGQRLAVVLAQANNDANSATTIGLVTESISNNQEGFITTFGNVSEVNTTGAKSYGGTETWVDGDMLYLSPSHAGYLTNVKPSAPDHLITIGYVVYAHAVHGKIFVKVDNGYELDELHNVQISSALNNEILAFNSFTSVWQNKSLSSIAGSSLVPSTRTLTINGTTYDLSADRSWSITSMIYPSAGIAVSTGSAWGTSITDNSSNWNTAYGWGNHASAGYLTSISSSLVTTALGYTPVTNARTITINGTAYDLSADRSWTISGGATGSGTTNYVSKWTSSSALGNSLLFDDGSKVGLNTATPDTLLHIYYNSIYTTWSNISHFGSGNGNSLFVSTGGYGFGLNDSSDRSGWGIQTDWDAGYMRFHYGTSDKVRILSNGNVGIGVTNPTKKLEVYSSVTGETAQLKLHCASSINSQKTYLGGYGVEAIWSSGGTYLFSSGGWNADTANNTIAVIGMHTENSNSYAFISTTNTNNSSPVERLRVLGNGNVGIGLTNPSYLLDVAGDINVTGSFRVNGTPFSSSDATKLPLAGGTMTGQIVSTATESLKMATNNCYLSGWNTGATTRYGYLQFTASALNLYSEAGSALNLGSNGVSAIYASTSQNIGIGTTSPLTKLHIIGETRTTGLRLNTHTTNNQGHRIYSRTMDVNAYNTATSMRFTIASGYNVQFQYEVTFHATRLSGTFAEIWYLKYTAGIAYDTAGNPNERWWDLREQAGNGIAGVGRSNQSGYFDIQNSAYDTNDRLTCVVAITCNNWDAVTVTFP